VELLSWPRKPGLWIIWYLTDINNTVCKLKFCLRKAQEFGIKTNLGESTLEIGARSMFYRNSQKQQRISGAKQFLVRPPNNEKTIESQAPTFKMLI